MPLKAQFDAVLSIDLPELLWNEVFFPDCLNHVLKDGGEILGLIHLLIERVIN